jgi:hypothetical protein
MQSIETLTPFSLFTAVHSDGVLVSNQDTTMQKQMGISSGGD